MSRPVEFFTYASDGTKSIEQDHPDEDIPDAPADDEREDCVKEEESL